MRRKTFPDVFRRPKNSVDRKLACREVLPSQDWGRLARIRDFAAIAAVSSVSLSLRSGSGKNRVSVYFTAIWHKLYVTVQPSEVLRLYLYKIRVCLKFIHTRKERSWRILWK